MTPSPAPAALLSYGPHPDQVADLFLPDGAGGADGARGAGAPLPLVLLFHGGVWREPHDRVHLRPFAAALAATGTVVASVEYRRVDGAGGWPETFDDVALAGDLLPDLVDASGAGVRVDRRAVALAGHSAGGHLALWSALRHLTDRTSPGHRAAPLPVAGVAALGAVVALTEFWRTSPDRPTVERLMGGDPTAVAGRYAAADPALLGPSACPVVLVHGSDDEAVPVQSARDHAASRARVRLVELPGTGHFDVIDPASAAWPAVVDAVWSALGRPRPTVT